MPVVISSSRSQVIAHAVSAAACLTGEQSSLDVRWCSVPAVAIVIHLVTRLRPVSGLATWMQTTGAAPARRRIVPARTLSSLGWQRTISLGTGLSCFPDHNICSSAGYFPCPWVPATDRLRPCYRVRNGTMYRWAERLDPLDANYRRVRQTDDLGS